jgi:N6-adenosine-specific RNA methylase IME4
MNGPYSILCIDPPWPKNKGGKRAVRPNQGASLDYDTMPILDIFQLLNNLIFEMATPQHTIFLWCIDEFLPICETQMLGRDYKLHARMIWDKTNGIAPAFSIRYTHEYVLWYYKPKFMQVAETFKGKYTTVFQEKAREHSRKPDYFYNMINNCFPAESKIDIFSREKRIGWNQWGNQTDHF